MSGTSGLVLDPYDRGARLYPALIAAFPVLLAGATVLPHVFGSDAPGLLASLGTACGILVLAAHLARDVGKAREAGWFAAQGGKPSVAMLRHRDGRLSEQDKARYRAFLAGRVPGVSLASAGEEARDPAGADAAYAAATAWLLEQTRDKARFGLLFRRNIDYGFRRNLTALRGFALACDAVLACAAAGALAAHWGLFSKTSLPPGPVAALVLTAAVLHAAFVAAKLRLAWVGRASEDYARQLLAACDALGTAGPAVPGRDGAVREPGAAAAVRTPVDRLVRRAAEFPFCKPQSPCGGDPRP